jgi:hypothetical protein
MNGRIYAPMLGRFLQADPFIPDASDSQSLNPYTYVLNNPLAYTDPSGYWGRREQGYLRTAVAIVIAVWTGYYAGGLAATNAWQAAAVAFVGGYAAGAVQTGTGKGALQGGLSSLVFFGINYHYGTLAEGGSGLSTTTYAERALVSGVAGGVLSTVQGGRFGNGFVSAGLGSALNPAISQASDNSYVQGFAAAIVGGTVSEASGGKFGNGAVTAAFAAVFGEALSRKGSPNEGSIKDDGYEHAIDNSERDQFAADNQFTITSAIGSIGGKFPELGPYLTLSNKNYNDDDGSWRWNTRTNSIEVNSMVASGEIRLSNQQALILISHEALHGLVYSYDSHYYARAIWSGLTTRSGPYEPFGGRPHLWIDNKGISVGNWLDGTMRTPRPNISSASYWGCVSAGGSCK